MNCIIFRNRPLFYRTLGTGDPVVLLHGFAEDGSIWNYLTGQIAKEFFVIVPDLPGSGHSVILDGNPGMTDYASAVKAIVDKVLGDKPVKLFTLIGHSMGGYIALAFAEKYPDRLNGIGLFHSTAFGDTELKKEARKKGIDFITHNGVVPFLKTSVPNLFAEKSKKKKPWLIESILEQYRYFSPEALIQYYRAMIKRPDRRAVLQRFQKPVLFLIGKEDKAVTLHDSLEQSYLPPIAFIKVLQHSAHMGMVEERNKATAFLRQFLQYAACFPHGTSAN